MTLTDETRAGEARTDEVARGKNPDDGVYVAPGRIGSLVEVKLRYENFIGGTWVAPVNGRYMIDISPVDGKPFTEVAMSSADDVELALDAAHAAKDAWGETSLAERADRAQRHCRRDRGQPRDAGCGRVLGERQAGA